MALGLPALIGLALASGGMGLAAGNAQRSLKEEADAKHFIMSTLQKELTDRASQGLLDEAGLDAIGKQALGKYWTPEIRNAYTSMNAASRSMREQQMALWQGITGGGQGATGAEAFGLGPQAPGPTPGVPGTSMVPPRPVGAGVAVPGGVAAPMPSAPSAVPSAASPAAVPEPVEPVGTYGGQPLVPQQPRPLVAQAPQPAQPTGDGDHDREVRSLLQGLRPAGGAASVTMQMPGMGSATIHPRDTLKQGILANAYRQNASPRALQAAMGVAGLSMDPKELADYGNYHMLKDGNLLKFVRQNQGLAADAPVSPEQIQAAMGQYAYRYGYAPAKDAMSILGGTQESVNQYFLTKFSGYGPNDNILRMANGLGIFPDDKTLVEWRARENRALEQRIASGNPNMAQNRAWLLREMKRNGAVLTPEQEREAAAYANIGEPASQGLQRGGVMPGLAANLVPSETVQQGPAGAVTGEGRPGARLKPPLAAVPTTAGGKTMAQQAHEAAQAEAVRQRGAESQASAAGTSAGKEQARPSETIPLDKIVNYTNPDTLEHPKAGTKYGQAEAPDTKFQFFTGTDKELNGIARLRRVEAMYEDTIEKLKPYMEKGSLHNQAIALGLVGRDIGLPRLGLSWRLPAGAAGDKMALKAFAGETPERARELANAVVRLNALADEAMSILRSPQYDEKGNLARTIVASNAAALPSVLNDSYLTARQKAKDFSIGLREMEQAFGLRRTEAYNPRTILFKQVYDPKTKQVIEVER